MGAEIKIDVQTEVNALNNWMAKIKQHFGGDMAYSFKCVEVFDGKLVQAAYAVECDLPAAVVNKVVHDTGRDYFARGRRYFFVYDKALRFLMLQFYPYYQVGGAVEDAETNGVEENDLCLTPLERYQSQRGKRY